MNETNRGDVVRIVCIGSGPSSIAVARYSKRIIKHGGSVTLITNERDYTSTTHAAELLSDRVRLADVSVPLKRYCERNGVELICGSVRHVDRPEQTVYVNNSSVHYDALLIDLPMQPDLTRVIGGKYALTCTTARDIAAIRHHVVSELQRLRGRDKDEHRAFVVVGMTARGIEIATALREHLNAASEINHILPSELAVILVSQRMDVFSTRTTERLVRILAARGVQYLHSAAERITETTVYLDDRSIQTGTVIWAADERADPFYATLGLPLDARELLETDAYLRSVDDERIFCADNSRSPVYTLTANLIATVRGKSLMRHREGSTSSIITTGNGKAALVTKHCFLHGSLIYRYKQHLTTAHRTTLK